MVRIPRDFCFVFGTKASSLVCYLLTHLLTCLFAYLITCLLAYLLVCSLTSHACSLASHAHSLHLVVVRVLRVVVPVYNLEVKQLVDDVRVFLTVHRTAMCKLVHMYWGCAELPGQTEINSAVPGLEHFDNFRHNAMRL